MLKYLTAANALFLWAAPATAYAVKAINTTDQEVHVFVYMLGQSMICKGKYFILGPGEEKQEDAGLCMPTKLEVRASTPDSTKQDVKVDISGMGSEHKVRTYKTIVYTADLDLVKRTRLDGNKNHARKDILARIQKMNGTFTVIFEDPLEDPNKTVTAAR